MSALPLNSTTSNPLDPTATFLEGKNAVEEMLRSGKGGTVTISAPTISGRPGNMHVHNGTVRSEPGSVSNSTAQDVSAVASETLTTIAEKRKSSSFSPNHSVDRNPQPINHEMDEDSRLRTAPKANPFVEEQIHQPAVVTTYSIKDPTLPVHVSFVGGSASYTVHPQSRGRRAIDWWKLAPLAIGGAIIAGLIAGPAIVALSTGIHPIVVILVASAVATVATLILGVKCCGNCRKNSGDPARKTV